jgi:hypothetical protein
MVLAWAFKTVGTALVKEILDYAAQRNQGFPFNNISLLSGYNLGLIPMESFL